MIDKLGLRSDPPLASPRPRSTCSAFSRALDHKQAFNQAAAQYIWTVFQPRARLYANDFRARLGRFFCSLAGNYRCDITTGTPPFRARADTLCPTLDRMNSECAPLGHHDEKGHRPSPRHRLVFSYL